MNFSNSDIVRLYGSRFFLVEEEEGSGVRGQGSEIPEEKTVRKDVPKSTDVGTVRQAVPEEQVRQARPEAVPEEKSDIRIEISDLRREEALTPITWKMRSTATVALVMDAVEFKNRMMTLALKNAVEAAGVDTSLIGFGVLEGEGENLDFSQMPVPVAIIFRPIADPVAPEGKKVYSMSTLGEIVLDTTKQDTLMALLKEITT